MDLLRVITGVVQEGWIDVKTQPWASKQEAIDTANRALSSFQRLLKKAATKNSKVIVSVKKEDSIDNKLARWEPTGRGVETMFDVLRGTIAVEKPEDIDEVIDNLSRGPRVVKYEHKSDPDETWGFYGTHHIDIYLPEFKVVAEVQVMTKRLLVHKKVAHKIYSKHRLEPEKTPESEKKRSKFLYKMGNISKEIIKKQRETPPDLSVF